MKYYEKLIEAIKDEDYYATDEILSLIKKEENLYEYIPRLLVFMEENPNIDYGMPGPLVHSIEIYYNKGYEELLYESIIRKPTIHTLWMLNRILNSPTLKERGKYLLALSDIVTNVANPKDVREEARHYLDYQQSKNS